MIKYTLGLLCFALFILGIEVFMITISKENIISYLKEHMPAFDDSLPAHISMIGEGTEEEDGDDEGEQTRHQPEGCCRYD